MSKITNEQVDQIINYTMGTCNPLSEACESIGVDEDDLTKEQLEHIDCMMFCCEDCGWWCDSGEQNESPNGDNVCDDCMSRYE